MHTTRDTVRYVDPSHIVTLLSDLTPYERKVIDQVNRKVAANESVEAVIDFLFKSTSDISPCDRIGLAFVEEDGERIIAHHMRAAYEPMLLKKGYTEGLRGSSLRRVLQMRTPRIINDLQQYADEHPTRPSPGLLLREGVRSSMTCPLEVEGKVVGVLFRSCRQPDAYNDRQVMLHHVVAERLSQAVAKTHCIAQLEAANHAYSNMLGFVSRELEGPLAGILADAQRLSDGYFGSLYPDQRKSIDRITERARKLQSQVDEYLNLWRVEHEDLKLNLDNRVDFLADVVEPSVDHAREEIDGHEMRLVCGSPSASPLVECDPNLLRMVLGSLLQNAVKYGQRGGEIRLRIERTGRSLRVSVWNQGPGFSPDERSRLFRKFSRLHTPHSRRQSGAGIALYVAWRIIQLHKGHLGAKSEPGQWAEFYFDIPQPVPQ